MVFVILFFIFILQTVWLFISELAGKDLDLAMILKFLMFEMMSHEGSTNKLDLCDAPFW